MAINPIRGIFKASINHTNPQVKTSRSYPDRIHLSRSWCDGGPALGSPGPARDSPGPQPAPAGRVIAIQARSVTGLSLNWVIRRSSATRSEISSVVSLVSRSAPNSSTLNEAIAVA